ncbi:hypothetical protein M409DRAFT_30124 [Zasmidium cellare ATCC 36951]|uniref:Uncharacterized protein n=1 Tax=Zasmidium cellare ATCC 36951 TaxID=1080233 RepID=A0A6A6BXP5_ZASCE|nr:uncharacterized protein M409DRAFT_30124 [Zasmidium cellare ATCC 36951]KAF2159373.1 hypothetical protein M409DRAFT_30124 [Zasmidium cellare ATCC 36951]
MQPATTSSSSSAQTSPSSTATSSSEASSIPSSSSEFTSSSSQSTSLFHGRIKSIFNVAEHNLLRPFNIELIFGCLIDGHVESIFHVAEHELLGPFNIYLVFGNLIDRRIDSIFNVAEHKLNCCNPQLDTQPYFKSQLDAITIFKPTKHLIQHLQLLDSHIKQRFQHHWKQQQ